MADTLHRHSESSLTKTIRHILEKRITVGRKILVFADNFTDPQVSAAFHSVMRKTSVKLSVKSLSPHDTTTHDETLRLLMNHDAAVIATGKRFDRNLIQKALSNDVAILVMPRISPAVLSKCLVENDSVEEELIRLKHWLKKPGKKTVKSSGGRSLTFGIRDDAIRVFDGRLTEHGEIDYIPPGCIVTLPANGTVEGRIRINGCVSVIKSLSTGDLTNLGIQKNAVELSLTDGKVSKALGQLPLPLGKIGREGEELNTVSEIAFGANPHLKSTANIYCDMNIASSVILGLGSNKHLGGDIGGDTHGDVQALGVRLAGMDP